MRLSFPSLTPAAARWLAGAAIAAAALAAVVLGALLRTSPGSPDAVRPALKLGGITQFAPASGGLWILQGEQLYFRAADGAKQALVEGVRSAAFAPDGSAAAYLTARGEVAVALPDGSSQLFLPAQPGREVQALRWGRYPAAQVLVEGGLHRHCVIYALSPGEPRYVGSCDGDVVDWYPAEELLLSVRDPENPALYHVIHRRETGEAAFYATSTEPIRILGERAGTLLVGTGTPMRLGAMRASPGAPLTEIPFTADRARLVPDGVLLIQGGRALFWSARTGESLSLGAATDAQLAPDGRSLWLLRDGDLIEIVLTKGQR